MMVNTKRTARREIQSDESIDLLGFELATRPSHAFEVYPSCEVFQNSCAHWTVFDFCFLIRVEHQSSSPILMRYTSLQVNDHPMCRFCVSALDKAEEMKYRICGERNCVETAS
jgi:hypothetical protein